MVYDLCFKTREDDNRRMRKDVNETKKTGNMNTKGQKLFLMQD